MIADEAGQTTKTTLHLVRGLTALTQHEPYIKTTCNAFRLVKPPNIRLSASNNCATL